MSRRDLLIELGCEELPARQIESQLNLLAEGLGSRLADAGLIGEETDITKLGTPRRLAVRIPGVAARQSDQVLERKGPAESAAFDADGKPTRAAEGFARSVGRSVDELERLENEQGRWLFARVEQPGQTLRELLPAMFDATIRAMAGARSMRWSDRDERFLRPVRWLVAIHGSETLDLDYFGLSAGRQTLGHRIHCPGPHELADAAGYEKTLAAAHVTVDPAGRREQIRHQAQELADQAGLQPVLHEDLIDEVAGLTEWPVAVLGRFSEDFLVVPEEALISSMEQHQKCFALRHADGRLAPQFIAVANLASQDPAAMTAGFERVIRPRLADARFFWNQDRKTTLADRRKRLDAVLFQQKLGSVGDKVRRLEAAAPAMAEAVGADAETTRQAAALCKCDLVTEMVAEFPELQGIMGRHYALDNGEKDAVATAIESHFRPRHAGDELPGDPAGRALALADRLDTLIGVFGAGVKPKGGKDPFALRRAALGVVRILEDSGTTRSVSELLEVAGRAFSGVVDVDDGLLDEVETFVFERLRPWAGEHGIDTNTVHAVAAGRPGSVADFMARARAVQRFADDPTMVSLIAANKRASNLLKQAGEETFAEVDAELLENGAERDLFTSVHAAESELDDVLGRADYPAALAVLSELREPLDRFFDDVMVMTDDDRQRANRLALLNRLRRLFLQLADVARLGR